MGLVWKLFTIARFLGREMYKNETRPIRLAESNRTGRGISVYSRILRET